MSYFPDSNDGPSRLRDLFGFVPRLMRLQAPTPEIVENQALLLEALLENPQGLDRPAAEKLFLAAATALRDPYGAALHQQMLGLLGRNESEAQRAMEGAGPLERFTQKLAASPANASAEDLAALRAAGIPDAEIVQAIVISGLAVFLRTLAAGSGARPDFAPPAFPSSQEDGSESAVAEKAAENIVHPEPQDLRPMVDAGEPDPDEDHVLRVQRGDKEAFAVLVERHSQRVYRTLLGILGDADEARDAMQDTFLRAFEKIGAFERRSKFSTWLLSIASNTGLQRLRDRKDHESLDETSDDQEYRPRQVRAWTDDPEQLYSKQEQRTLVERSIARLPAKYRMVVMLRDVQQMSTEDAAAALGLGVPALKARLIRGRLMLRESLTPHFAQTEASA